MALRIRIVSTPPGEAPQWVREQWVGCELPLAHGPAAETFLTVGVLKGHSRWRHLWEVFRGRAEKVDGYFVNVATAVSLLEAKSPEAAAWWMARTPSLLKNGNFVFHIEACALLDS
ncbi:MAG TPA: hypothetical protein VK522_19835 [Pseudolabrys sp.]|jgi:hypothetical protein|nr:hypothetical protein [Pseudolabrys sp.]